jgi:hypothetical protein
MVMFTFSQYRRAFGRRIKFFSFIAMAVLVFLLTLDIMGTDIFKDMPDCIALVICGMVLIPFLMAFLRVLKLASEVRYAKYSWFERSREGWVWHKQNMKTPIYLYAYLVKRCTKIEMTPTHCIIYGEITQREVDTRKKEVYDITSNSCIKVPRYLNNLDTAVEALRKSIMPVYE